MKCNQYFIKKAAGGLVHWIMLFAVFIGLSVASSAQTTFVVQPAAGGGTTGLGSGPSSANTFNRAAHIYASSELNELPSTTPITHIGFSYTGLPPSAITGNIKMYVQSTADASFLKSTTWTTTITGMTLVYDGPITIPNTGNLSFDIPLQTPFTYTGTNLYVAYDFQLTSAPMASLAYNASTAFVGGGNGARRVVAATLPPTLTGSSAFRAQLRFGYATQPNDANVMVAYTLGKTPVPYGNPHVISARVKNTGLNVLTNLNVSLAVVGANTYNDVQVVPSMNPGDTALVTFAGWSPSVIGANTWTVSVPTDDIPINDIRTGTIQTTAGAYAYKDPSKPNNGGVGFTGGTGDFVAKFSSAIANNINELLVDFSAGNVQIYRVGIWDATGPGGTPGTNLWTSGDLTQGAGTAFIPVAPAVPVNGSFFVGVRQIGTVNISFAYQTEAPIRGQSFYFASPTGSTTWNDFAPNSPFRFSIEARLQLPVPPNCAVGHAPADGFSTPCGNTPITLSWASGGGAPTGYKISYGITPSADDIVNGLNIGNVTSYNPVGLVAGNTYYWKVTPYNADGDAPSCIVRTFTLGNISPTIQNSAGDSRCGAGIVNLTANANGPDHINWYANASGGAPLNTGNSYSPTVSANTNFYIAAESGTPQTPLTTTFASGNGQQGNMFNITALNTVTITGFDGHVAAGLADWAIYYRPNSFIGNESSNLGWTLLGTAAGVNGAGIGLPTSLPIELNVLIPSGQTYGFYVTRTDGGFVEYTNGTTLNAVLYSDANIQFREGNGGALFAVINSPRNFNGRIKYSTGTVCQSSRQIVTATVTAPDPILASALSNSICLGQSTDLSVALQSGTATYNYTWMPGNLSGANQTVSPSTTTTYTVNAVDPNPPFCVTSSQVTVVVNPIPVLNVNASSNTICSGDPVTLNANAVSNDTWNFAHTGGPVTIVDLQTKYATATASGVSGTIGTAGLGIGSVCIDITHTWVSDLNIYLVHPNGVDSLLLTAGNGGSDDDYTGTCFVTGGALITAGVAPFTGVFAPQGVTGFAKFNGLSPNGIWKLSVFDQFSGDVGTINSFEIQFSAPSSLQYSWSASPADPSLVGQEAMASPVVSPTTGTTYLVSVTNTNTACNESGNTSVAVNPAINASVTPPGPIDICDGSSVLLTAASGPAYSYSWNNSETTQSILADAAGTYFVTVSVVGCNPIVSNGVIVNIMNNPAVISINPTVNNNPCPGASYDLVAVGPAGTYSWTGPNGFVASGQNVLVTTSGTYSVIFNDGVDPCPTVPSTINITTNACQTCATPTGLAHSNVGAVSADISWSPAFVGDDFLVRYWNINTPGAIQYLSVSGTPAVSSMTLNYLSQNTTYVWQVKTLCNSPQPYSKYSQPDTFTTIFGNAPCTYRPSGLFSFGYTPTTADLYWDPVNADAFLVRYEVAGTGIYQWQSAPGAPGNVSFGSLTGLYPNTTYNWWVLGICSGVKSRYSAMGTFTTDPGTIPCVKPFDTRAINIGTTTATIEWNTIVSADQFRVRYVVNGPAPWNWAYKTVSGVPHTNVIPLSGLLPNTTYRFQVQTICAGIKSDYSTVETFLTLPTPSGQSRSLTEDVRGSLSLNAYPNPAKDKVTISFGAENEGGKYVARLLDLSGRMLMERNGTASKGQYQEELDLNGLAAGMYLLEVRMGEKQGFLRLTVE